MGLFQPRYTGLGDAFEDTDIETDEGDIGDNLDNAVDEDDIKLDVCYFVVSGDEEEAFAVNPITHEIMALQPLDREEKDTHEIIIKATEECLHQPEKIDRFNSSDDSLIKLKIYVNDENDNAWL